MFEIIPRTAWGARHDNGFGPRRLPASEVWLHHSVTIAPDLLPPFDDDYQAIRDLEEIGEARFGKGISYTRLITPTGLIFEGHGIDRVGSHTADHNTVACGYCLVGNYEVSKPTAEQLLALAWLLQHDYGLGWLSFKKITGGHRDLKATACPGKYAYAQISYVNSLAAGPPITQEQDMHVDSMTDEVANKIADKVLWRDSDPQEDENVPVWASINGIRDRVDELKGQQDRMEQMLGQLIELHQSSSPAS